MSAPATTPEAVTADAERLRAETDALALDRARLADLERERDAVRSLNATLSGLAAELPSQATLDQIARQQATVSALRQKRDALLARKAGLQ